MILRTDNLSRQEESAARTTKPHPVGIKRGSGGMARKASVTVYASSKAILGASNQGAKSDLLEAGQKPGFCLV